MRQLKGFKLVTQGMESLFNDDDYRRIKYRLRHPVKPKQGCGPLAVFKTLQSAQMFQCHKDRLFSCTYIPSTTQYLYDSYNKAYDMPSGTDFADQVTLREEIKSLRKDK